MRIMSFLVWPALIAPVFAPLAGGALTTYLSWHWIFLINVPLGLVAFALALRLIESPQEPRPPPLDRVGVLLSGAGLAALAYVASLVSEASPDWVLVAALVVFDFLALSAALRHPLRARNPLVDL